MHNIFLIPYRKREKHLKYFLEKTLPLLKKHLDNIKIVIIEQVNDKLFNRGLLLNIGFKENLNYEDALFFTHDVDVNPTEQTIITYYKDNIPDVNTIKGIYTSRFNTLGGVICFKKEPFLKINGFPNNFWGWGTEDKVLQNRAEFYKINTPKNILDKSALAKTSFLIFEDEHSRKKSPNSVSNHIIEYNHYYKMNEQQKINRNNELGGINNMTYNIIDKSILDHDIELLKVNI